MIKGFDALDDVRRPPVDRHQTNFRVKAVHHFVIQVQKAIVDDLHSEKLTVINSFNFEDSGHTPISKELALGVVELRIFLFQINLSLDSTRVF